MHFLKISLCVVALSLTGCVSPPEPVEPVVDTAEAMTYLGALVRPELLLFPEYLLMDGYELKQHGRIPETTLVGAGMKTEFPLHDVRSQFNQILKAYGWTLDGVEIGKQSFRLVALLNGDQVEIRAVQGSGDTQLFVLYTPADSV